MMSTWLSPAACVNAYSRLTGRAASHAKNTMRWSRGPNEGSIVLTARLPRRAFVWQEHPMRNTAPGLLLTATLATFCTPAFGHDSPGPHRPAMLEIVNGRLAPSP